MSSTRFKCWLRVTCVAVALMIVQGCGVREWRQRNRLFAAVLHGDAKKVQALLEDGLDPNTEGYKGGRAISYADDPQIVALLIEHGANVDDNYAELALRGAISNGHGDVVDTLLKAGVDPNGRYYWGGTPVMEAAETGQIEMLRTLLEYGGDPNVLGRYGGSVGPEECQETALSVAAWNGHVEAVRLLLDHNADASYRDSHGCTAAMAAKNSGHPELATMIDAKEPSN